MDMKDLDERKSMFGNIPDGEQYIYSQESEKYGKYVCM